MVRAERERLAGALVLQYRASMLLRRFYKLMELETQGLQAF